MSEKRIPTFKKQRQGETERAFQLRGLRYIEKHDKTVLRDLVYYQAIDQCSDLPERELSNLRINLEEMRDAYYSQTSDTGPSCVAYRQMVLYVQNVINDMSELYEDFMEELETKHWWHDDDLLEFN